MRHFAAAAIFALSTLEVNGVKINQVTVVPTKTCPPMTMEIAGKCATLGTDTVTAHTLSCPAEHTLKMTCSGAMIMACPPMTLEIAGECSQMGGPETAMPKVESCSGTMTKATCTKIAAVTAGMPTVMPAGLDVET